MTHALQVQTEDWHPVRPTRPRATDHGGADWQSFGGLTLPEHMIASNPGDDVGERLREGDWASDLNEGAL